MKKFKYIIIPFLSILLLLFIGSCDKRTLDYPDYQIVHMTAVPDLIYADNNITFSTISVLVKDEDNFAITGETVTFRADIGSILKNIITDSSGVAVTTFWDSGDIGLATIEAFISDVSASVQVLIDSIPNIESLEFTQIPANLDVGEIATVKARAMNEIGVVSDGTIIVFETSMGYFQTIDGIEIGDIVSEQTSNGYATVILNAGTQCGLATMTAQVSSYIATQGILIHPGNPRFLYLFPETNVVAANSGETVTIIAQVEDSYHNPVESGVGVIFTTDLGTVTEFGNTDSMGTTFTVFSPGIQAGIAQIDAVADSATASTFITVTSDDVHSIVFDFLGIVDIQVQGTGGQESFELSVSLKDMSGNLVDENLMVHFELLNYPEGTNINNVGIFDSTMSTNGHAVVSINSGAESGIVRVRAYTYDSEGEVISAEKSNIVVHAGPPNSAQFTISGHDTGIDMSGGIWRIQVAAMISDCWGNPVDDGTAAYFSLPEDPPYAYVEAAAYVGNENVEGDSLPGTAYTFLDYDGAFTNEIIQIMVEVGGIETYPGELVLPIQFAVIDMVPVPQHLDWVIPNDTSPKETEIRITVNDGQNNEIDNQEVVFFTTLGTPLEPYPPDTGDPYTGLTGVVDGVHGRLYKVVQYQKYECPPPGPGGAGSTTGTVTAQILGTQVSNNTTIILFRYVD
jgi:hypothetical protein